VPVEPLAIPGDGELVIRIGRLAVGDHELPDEIVQDASEMVHNLARRESAR